MKQLAFLICAFILSMVALAETNESKGRAIAEEADRRASGFQDYRADMVMILRNRNAETGRRDMHIKVLEMPQDGERSLIVFDTPRDVKGSALLTHSHASGSDDQWLYLPAVRRVKRISSSNRSSPFMGSEFSYEDMTSSEVDEYTYLYLRDDELLGNRVFVVERYPRTPGSGYTRQVVWIDKVEYFAYKVEYFDRKNALLKTLTLSDHKKHLGKFWRAHTMSMINHQTGKSTILTWDNFQFRTGLSEAEFSSNLLERAR